MSKRKNAADVERKLSCGHTYTLRHTACPTCFGDMRMDLSLRKLEIASLRAQLADRDAEIKRLRTEAGLDSSQREDELRAALAQAQAKAGALRVAVEYAVGCLSADGVSLDVRDRLRAALSSTAGRSLLERVRRYREVLSDLCEAVAEFCNQPGVGISGKLGARLTDARTALRKEEGE